MASNPGRLAPARSHILSSLLLHVDYILMLNNYLQSTGEAHLLSWEFTQTGPGHQATHTAVAKRALLSPRRAEGVIMLRARSGWLSCQPG
jgi:hypothetical protein